MLHLLMGTDWVSVREEILRRVAQDVQEEKTGRILMVPELISHDTERRLCAAAGDTASRFAEVLSFTRLTRRVADSMGCGIEECMDNGGRVVAMAASARQLASRLKAYAAVETKPEFLLSLVEAVDEFKRCCITPQDLVAASGQTQGSLAQKLEELSLLLEGYDSLCAQGKRDPRDQMNWLREQLEAGDFGSNHVFYIDGFPDFTRQHLAILETLILTSDSVTVGLNCDCVNSQALAFEKAGDTAAQLLRCAKHAGVEVDIQIVPAGNTPLAPVHAGLLQGKIDSCDCAQAWRAESPAKEVQAVAEQILCLVRGGCRYRDIAVVCGDFAGYKDILRLEFNRCGIPLYLSGTEDILQKTVISTVLSALEAALGGFERQAVLRYMKSVLSPLSQDDCDLVENYAILWDIRGKQWLSPWVNHPDGLGEIWTETAENRLQQLNAARTLAIEPLLRLNRSFKEAKNLSQQVEGLYAFLEEISLAKRMEDLAAELDEQGNNRGAQILNQLWDILLGALEQLHDALGNTVWEEDAFVRLLTLLLGQYDVGTIPPVLDAVTAGPVSAMRCQQEKHLFVLGAEEGVLPGYSGSAGILSDQERVELRKLGVSLTGGAMEGLQAEFAEVYGVFCGARETVTVSCADGQPSYLYARLAQMAGGEKEVAPMLGGAMTDANRAGAWLAKQRDEKTAKELGLEERYKETLRKAEHSLGKIERENISKLYGNTLNLSASQVDRQAECRLSYFLKYGMRAKERKAATVDPAEFGTYVHAVLENTARKVMELGGFQEVSMEKTMEIAMEYSDSYTAEHFAQIDSQRLRYLFQRNRRELEMVVAELYQELKASKFAPWDFELAFGEGGKMPAIEIPAEDMRAVLRGFVDRVDIWQENDQIYFRVVDYKTGRKDFDYCDVFNGVGLQMLLYLFALEQAGEALLGENPVASGVQYFPARAPLLTSDGLLTQEEADKLRIKEWKRKGLLLQEDAVLEAMDPENTGRLSCTWKKDGTLSGDFASREQMKILRSYVFQTLSNMVKEIASGDVTPNPYTRGLAHNACSYCPYGSICDKNNVLQRRNYKAMTAQRFWEELGKELGDG